jgi:hypothetical protein
MKSEQSRIKLHCFFIPCYNACHKPKEVTLAKRAGAFKSEKRRKEMSRQKKQEEKRQRRFSKGDSALKDTETIDSDKDKEQQNQ